MRTQTSPLSSDPEPAPETQALPALDRLILALDFPSAKQSLHLLDQLSNRTSRPPRWVKVGLELFLAEGSPLVRTLRERGYRVFLDLKLHDIPNTVAGAVRALAPLDVEMVTVHASGGPAMMEAAAEAAAALTSPLRLLAVTVLTSMDAAQLRAAGVAATPPEQVLQLAHQAWRAGIRGLVASPLEAVSLREEFGTALHLVTPGIRLLADPGTDDQRRVATPASALRAGASQLVIGRPITQAADPAAAYEAILTEMEVSC